MRPATTGETENGRSISAVSNVRPGKRKREMLQAAAMPKTRFVTTAIGATVIVRRIAASVSSSAVSVRQYAPKPRPNASTKTSTSGITIRTPTTPSAAATSVMRTQRGSEREFVWSGVDTFAPPLEQVDDDEHGEGDHEEHDGDGGRLRVGELLEPRDDEHGCDLGLERHVARHEHDRAVLAERAREGEGEAGHERRVERRKDDSGDGLEARRAEARGCLLDVRVDTLEHRLERTHDEGEADEYEHEDDREAGVGGLDAERNEETPEPSRLDVEARVDEPGDRRRQRER